MKYAALVLGLLLVFFVTTGVNECDRPGQNERGKPDCWPCQVEIHLNAKCEPVDADGNSMNTVNVHPGSRICFINDADCSMRLTFPSALFGKDTTEENLAADQCVQLRIDRQAARKTITYQIACDCPEADGGAGNPTFKVGGGGGG